MASYFRQTNSSGMPEHLMKVENRTVLKYLAAPENAIVLARRAAKVGKRRLAWLVAGEGMDTVSCQHTDARKFKVWNIITNYSFLRVMLSVEHVTSQQRTQRDLN